MPGGGRGGCQARSPGSGLVVGVDPEAAAATRVPEWELDWGPLLALVEEQRAGPVVRGVHPMCGLLPSDGTGSGSICL